jgi:hypothetical protein
VQGIKTASIYCISQAVSHRCVLHEHTSTTRPAGVLCGIRWGDQVPLNGSASHGRASYGHVSLEHVSEGHASQGVHLTRVYGMGIALMGVHLMYGRGTTFA